jgi:hypothetical protein
MRANPSLERTSTGKGGGGAGPGGGERAHGPRAQSALPVASAQLKR